jgi:hypothetical protein
LKLVVIFLNAQYSRSHSAAVCHRLPPFNFGRGGMFVGPIVSQNPSGQWLIAVRRHHEGGAVVRRSANACLVAMDGDHHESDTSNGPSKEPWRRYVLPNVSHRRRLMPDIEGGRDNGPSSISYCPAGLNHFRNRAPNPGWLLTSLWHRPSAAVRAASASASLRFAAASDSLAACASAFAR